MSIIIKCDICGKPLAKTHWNKKYHAGKCSMEGERRRVKERMFEKKMQSARVTITNELGFAWIKNKIRSVPWNSKP